MYIRRDAYVYVLEIYTYTHIYAKKNKKIKKWKKMEWSNGRERPKGGEP